jgi:hypothetical protein
MFPDERRRHPRFPFHAKGELSLDFMSYRGRLIDISLFGALFEVGLFELRIAHGDGCRLKVLTLADESLFAVDGMVAHARRNLIGIEFGALDDERREWLQRISALNLAPAKILDRKLPVLLQAWPVR